VQVSVEKIFGQKMMAYCLDKFIFLFVNDKSRALGLKQTNTCYLTLLLPIQIVVKKFKRLQKLTIFKIHKHFISRMLGNSLLLTK
jgi:hypothetical protein